jgi:hypothetical protein
LDFLLVDRAAYYTLIASFISILLGINGITFFWENYFNGAIGYAFLSLGVLGLLAFAFGIGSGIMTAKKRNYTLSIGGACFLLLQSIASMLVFWLVGLWGNVLVDCVPMLILSTLSLVRIARSKEEFS